MKRGYLRAEDGSLAIATAIGGALLCGAAGLAIIVAQGNLGKSQLQASLDAAVLGAVSLPFGVTDAKRIGTAQAIFDANIAEYVKPAESVFQSISSPTFTVKAGIVSGEASSSVKNGFAAMVGISKMDIKQHAAARKALSDPLCVLALNPQQSATIEIYGNAEMRANDCAVLAPRQVPACLAYKGDFPATIGHPNQIRALNQSRIPTPICRFRLQALAPTWPAS
jgi:Flp pilus assembly protein TadG